MKNAGYGTGCLHGRTYTHTCYVRPGLKRDNDDVMTKAEIPGVGKGLGNDKSRNPRRGKGVRNSLLEGENGIGWDLGALRPLRVAADRCGKR